MKLVWGWFFQHLIVSLLHLHVCVCDHLLSGGHMASSTGRCNWLIYPQRTTLSDWPVKPRVSSCDIQGQPQAHHSKSWSGFRNIHALTHIHRLFKGCAVLSCRFNWYGNDTGFTRWTSLLSLKKFLFEDFFSSLRSKRLIGVWVSMNPVVLMSFMVIFITSHKELLMA